MTLYKKVGRKYIAIASYDNALYDHLPYGTHLIICNEGTTRIHNIDPAYAPLIAAGKIAQDSIAESIMNESDLRPTNTVITKEQNEAWIALSNAFGETRHLLQWPSAREVAEKAVARLIDEADKLMQNESVRNAYDHFLLMCKLSTEEKK
jgi:hypothetical protein